MLHQSLQNSQTSGQFFEQLYTGDDPSGSLPLFRAVIHQSHCFLVWFPDPSLFLRPPSQGLCSKRFSSPNSILILDERSWYKLTSSSRRGRGGSMTPDSNMSHSSHLPHPFILLPLLVHVFLWPKHIRTKLPTALHTSFDAWHSLTSQNSHPFFTAFITCHHAYPTSFSFFPLPLLCNCAMSVLAGTTSFALHSLSLLEEWHKRKVTLISGKFPLPFFWAY